MRNRDREPEDVMFFDLGENAELNEEDWKEYILPNGSVIINKKECRFCGETYDGINGHYCSYYDDDYDYDYDDGPFNGINEDSHADEDQLF